MCTVSLVSCGTLHLFVKAARVFSKLIVDRLSVRTLIL